MNAAPSWLERVACVAVAAAAGVALFATVSGQPLMGWDTYPEIETSRIEGVSDFFDTFREQTAEGYYPAPFYRPVFNLLLAGSYALWGLEPIGFQALGAALVALCGLALFGLSRALLGVDRRAGPWTTLIVFLLLPVHAEVVPLAPRYMDPLCLLFSVLALWTQVRVSRSGWAPAIFTLLAVGSKEVGVLLPLLIFLLGWARSDQASRAIRLRAASRLAAPHALAVAVVFAARFAAIGGLGGHASTAVSGAFTRWVSTLGTTGVTLSGLWTTADRNPPEWALGSIAVLLGFAALASLEVLLRRPGSIDEPAGRGSPLAVALGLAWLIGLAFVYAASGFVEPWHHLIPGAAAALAVGAGAQALANSRAGTWRVPAAVGLSCIALWAALQARHSPIFHDYGHWHRGGDAVEAYLQGISLRIAGQRSGDVVSVGPPPNWKPADPNPVGAKMATLLAVYSLPAWARLHFPDRSIEFRHETLASDSSEPDPDKIVVLVRGGS